MTGQVQLPAPWTHRPRRRCSRFNAGLIASIFIALGIVTSAQPAAAQAGKVEKPNITFGVFPITNYGVVYLSLQQGFFQAEGLNVTPRVMGANPVAGIVGGDFDTGGVTWTAFLLATNRGVPLRPLSEADRGSKGQALFMVKNDSAIKTTEDLVGKKIAVVTVGGACDLILNDVLHKKGSRLQIDRLHRDGRSGHGANGIARRRRCGVHPRAASLSRAGPRRVEVSV